MILVEMSERLCIIAHLVRRARLDSHKIMYKTLRFCVLVCEFSPPCGLTNEALCACTPNPQDLRGLLTSNPEVTPQQLQGILAIKKQFYIYYHIKNLFFNYFCINRYRNIRVPMPNNPCTDKAVSYHITQ